MNGKFESHFKIYDESNLKCILNFLGLSAFRTALVKWRAERHGSPQRAGAVYAQIEPSDSDGTLDAFLESAINQSS
jgi:hypothetical protein